MDIFSRYVVGWMVAHREAATLAGRLTKETCRKQDIKPGQLMDDLHVHKTHSRPCTSSDNPYSEARFKTLKYGNAGKVIQARQFVLLDAFAAHPERFVNKVPQPRALPESVWINPPKPPLELEKKEVIAL